MLECSTFILNDLFMTLHTSLSLMSFARDASRGEAATD